MTRVEILKNLIREPYAFPGGYEKFAIMDDGETVCWKCCRDNYVSILHSTRHDIRDGWNLVAVDAECNADGPVYCAHCGKTIIEDWRE